MEHRKILVVDDEADLVETYLRLLRALGYSCLGAQDGLSAEAMADREQPALLLTDLNMPNLDGFELIRRFRAKWPTTPVIAMTAFHTAQTEEAVNSLGANAYLRKPFSNADLVAAIRSALPRPGA